LPLRISWRKDSGPESNHEPVARSPARSISCAEGCDQLVDLFAGDPVHAHEPAQNVEVRVAGKAPLKSLARTVTLICAMSPTRMLTQDLLRESCSAMSARLRWRVFLSSSMKAACSRMPKALVLEIRKRFTIPLTSSCPARYTAPGAVAACAHSDNA